MNKKRTNTAKKTIFIICLALCMVMVAGTTLAYLLDKTEPVNNTFNPSKVTVEVAETMNADKTVKSNVNVKNTGDINAYLRAKVLVNWAHVEGNATEISYIRGDAPVENTDYVISYNLTDTGWFLGSDGFYYFKNAVKPQTAAEEVLVTSVSLKEGVTAPEGYTLYVEILAQGIQADGEILEGSTIGTVGTPAVTNAWGVTVAEDGTISK